MSENLERKAYEDEISKRIGEKTVRDFFLGDVRIDMIREWREKNIMRSELITLSYIAFKNVK